MIVTARRKGGGGRDTTIAKGTLTNTSGEDMTQVVGLIDLSYMSAHYSNMSAHYSDMSAYYSNILWSSQDYRVLVMS